jgi:HupE / UreJ protein
MCIAERLARLPLFALAAWLACAAAPVLAHPVAQGAIAVQAGTDGLQLHAQISLEEVSVGSLHAGHGALPAAERIRHYGEYLLQHMYIEADGQRLQGHLLEMPQQLADPLLYRIDYSYAQGRPQQLRFSQDALREYLFAPGNPWEARYLLRVAVPGQADAPARLLTPQQPLRFQWSPDAAVIQPLDSGTQNLYRDLLADGIHHILSGYDHLLFVAALLLAVTGLWELVKVVTAFTLAHSLTLALATYGLLRLPADIVEPVIAASIVAVAVQNLCWPRQSQGGPRLATAFVFGLFHGLGYAGGLLDALQALSVQQTAWALAAFSLGVEIGHQIVVVPLFLLLALWRRHKPAAARGDWVLRGGSALIGVAGLGYLLAALQLTG